MKLNRAYILPIMLFYHTVYANDFELKIDKNKTNLGTNSVVTLYSREKNSPDVEEVVLPENIYFTNVYVTYSFPFKDEDRRSRKMSYLFLIDSNGSYHLYYARFKGGKLSFYSGEEDNRRIDGDKVDFYLDDEQISTCIVRQNGYRSRVEMFISDSLSVDQTSQNSLPAAIRVESSESQTDCINDVEAGTQTDRICCAEAGTQTNIPHSGYRDCQYLLPLSINYTATPSPRYLCRFPKGVTLIKYIPWSPHISE